jgi:transcriptional regulator with XRE-family HTH domain
MKFADIEERLLDNLRARVKRREISERRLALQAGFSQPHIHNVLKGARQLTSEVADRLMERLGLDIEGLFETSELERVLPHREFKDSPFREVPMLKGRIAAGQPFPVDVRYAGTRAFTAEFLKQFVRPVLVKAGATEVSMLPTIQPNDLLLIDQSEEKRRHPVFGKIYALNLDEGGTTKHCEVVNGELVIVPENMQQRGFSPRTISLEEHNILDIVRGVVVWIGREL